MESWSRYAVSEYGTLPWLMIFLLSVVIVTGGFTNIACSLVTITGRLRRKSEGYVYLLAIFIANFLMLIFAAQRWLYIISGYHVSRSSYHGCRAYFFVSDWLNPVVTWLSVAFLFDVYFQRCLRKDRGQCSARFARYFCRNSVATAVVLAVFALTGTVALLYMLNSETFQADNHYYSAFSDWFVQSKLWIAGEISLVFVPLLILLPLAFLLVAGKNNTMPNDTTEDRDAYDSCLHFPTSAVLSLAAAVFFLQIPYESIKFAIDFKAMNHSDTELPPIVLNIVELLVALTYVCVPGVCTEKMPEIKNGFKKMFPCCGEPPPKGGQSPLIVMF